MITFFLLAVFCMSGSIDRPQVLVHDEMQMTGPNSVAMSDFTDTTLREI